MTWDELAICAAGVAEWQWDDTLHPGDDHIFPADLHQLLGHDR